MGIYLHSMTLTAFLILMFQVVSTFKIAIFEPQVSNSQIIWNYRMAEALHKAGHNVTLIELGFGLVKTKKFPLSEGIERWSLPSPTVKSAGEEYAKEMLDIMYEEVSSFSSNQRKMITSLRYAMVTSCEDFVKNKEFLKKLKEAKFDLAFADMAGMCSIGFIHAARIPTWIWMNNAPLLDYIADISGVSSPSSYVSSAIGSSVDRMTFFERVQSFISWSIIPFLYKRYVADTQTELFRKYIDPNFPHLLDIAANVPLIMVNSDEMYALPRPILHKIVYIGGLGMTKKAAKPLKGEYKKIADRASNIIIFSFGSIANATLMPTSWKNAFMSAFKNFPEVEFFMRYDGTDLEGKIPKNVHISNWLPQSDLINLDKTRALITHGGYNSLQEAINSATPVIAVPLFGDQPSNAKLAVKNHFGVSLKKSEINTEMVSKAIRTILQDDSYAKTISRMRDMISSKPYTPEELLTRWTEFTAKFKDLSNLTPQSIHLSFIQYYCIDVVAFLITVLVLVNYASYRLLLYVFKKLFRKSKKSKKE